MVYDGPSLAIVGDPPVVVINIAGKKSYFQDLILGLKSFVAFHFAFNIEYLKEARAIWYFVQHFLFRINPEPQPKKKGYTKYLALAKELGLEN